MALSTIVNTKTAPFRLSNEPSTMQLLAKYFRVLGDSTRLHILELVVEERSVSELVRLLSLSQSKVSNHLACLSWCGFVVSRREHRTIYYRLADERISHIVSVGRTLLASNATHVSNCCVVDGKTNEGAKETT